MRWERTAEEAALSGSVRTVGVCDVMRLELQPVHHAPHVEQVEPLRPPLQDEIAHCAAETRREGERTAETLRLAQSRCT
jgi:hypothetical protein